MVSEVADLGKTVETVSVLCMWPVVLLRARAAVRCTRQRGIWLAVATAAAATTLNLPPVTRLVEHITGPTHLTALAMNLCGVLSAAAVLDFTTTATGARHRPQLHAAVGLVLVTLVVLDLTAPHHVRHTSLGAGPATPSMAYWLVIIGTHLSANLFCARVCLRYSGCGSNRALRTSLRLFGLGTACAGVFWSAYLADLLLGPVWVPPILPYLMGLHGLLRAAALAVPAAVLLRAAVAELLTFHRLWPLWRDLVDAVPAVTLAERRPWILELLRPQGPRHFAVYRTIVEIRDAILVLRDYVQPERPVTDPAALARLLRDARRNKLDGQRPRTPDVNVAEAGGEDIAAETAYLVQVARAYRALPAPSLSR
ncbi:MAB_1171c family putative transporter [Streptomyces sp. NPDC006703]|uniref:MAB_1171c family putative transporter n=1 Tax=Streptomyces sp. NPDC006703 TaxID=3364759 RepID=UPI0036ACE620